MKRKARPVTLKPGGKPPAKAARRKSEFQDPHALIDPRGNRLEVSIGHEVREFRRKLDMTVAEA